MNSLEARAQVFEVQKARWLKLSINTRKAIEDAAFSGSLNCFIDDLSEVEIQCLRMLGYNVRKIVENTFEISW